MHTHPRTDFVTPGANPNDGSLAGVTTWNFQTRPLWTSTRAGLDSGRDSIDWYTVATPS